MRKTGRTIACLVCSKDFYVRGSSLRRGRKYCSDPCYREHTRKRERRCAECGAIFMPHNRQQETCSYRCSKLATRNPRWIGGRIKTVHGYILALAPGHPKADKDGYVREHVLVAEKAVGKYLPPGAEVHHVNEVKSDNRPENLVICQDLNYHRLLHRRMRALKREQVQA